MPFAFCVNFMVALPRLQTGLTISLLPFRPTRVGLLKSPPFRHISSSLPTRRVLPSHLLEGNAQWREGMTKTESNILRENASGQSPSILWIGCSDSRVPESVVAKCRPGDIFTHRNIAGQFSETDDSAMSVLTYAVEVLGVEHVILVGHTSCGGVQASLTSARDTVANPLPSSHLHRFLGPLIELCAQTRRELGIKDGEEVPEQDLAPLVKKATEANVKAQVEKVAASGIIQSNWAGKNSAFFGEPKAKVQVHGWVSLDGP